MNLMVAIAIVLLNLTVAVWYYCWIPRFVWSTRSPDVATSICAVAE